MSSSRELQSFSSKALHAFPNTLISSTAHLSCQPQPGFSMHGSTWALPAQGRLMAHGRLTEELPQAESFNSGLQGWQFHSYNLTTPAVCTGSPRRISGWGRRGPRKEPCSTSDQLVAVQNHSQEQGWQMCWARETPQVAQLPVTEECRLQSGARERKQIGEPL